MAHNEGSVFTRTTIDKFGVAVIEINRPQKRNALSQDVIDGLIADISVVEKDSQVRAVVLTGSPGGPFSAGADIGELVDISSPEGFKREYLKDLSDAIGSMRKPIIAAVLGFALGGGFELAMMCDIIIAAKDAKFGLPELSIGTIPGAGGTQRLARTLGKFKTMELILTSATLTGEELEHLGLVSRSLNKDEVLSEAMKSAYSIAAKSNPVVQLAKQAILSAEEMSLQSGLQYERALYYSSFSLHDKHEGMTAFKEKRPPVFKHC
ncbi:ClpP/crotonase-like domain-containing protein [Bisporella sp. PMI_857]|nr:ClpP/crotonase-like domain-containing protein [Bisporella sp. PMI_857]